VEKRNKEELVKRAVSKEMKSGGLSSSNVMSSIEGFKNQRIIYQQQTDAIDEMKRKVLQQNKLHSSQKENFSSTQPVSITSSKAQYKSPQKKAFSSAVKPKANRDQTSPAFKQIDQNIAIAVGQEKAHSRKTQSAKKLTSSGVVPSPSHTELLRQSAHKQASHL
jgi:hypothetical protein